MDNHFSKFSTFQGRFVQGNWTLPPYHKAESLNSLVKWGTALRLPWLSENHPKSQPDTKNAFFKLGVIIPEALRRSKSYVLDHCYLLLLFPFILIFIEKLDFFQNYSPGTKKSTLKLGPIRPWIFLILHSPSIVPSNLDWRFLLVDRSVFSEKFIELQPGTWISKNKLEPIRPCLSYI